MPYFIGVRLLALGSLISLLIGCVSGRPRDVPGVPTLAPRYYGTWQNIDPHYLNWWVIGADGAVNYGLASNDGKCVRDAVIVTASNQIDVRFGNSGQATLRLAEGDLLLFQAERGVALHKRVDASSVCRKPDGTYLDGAPYKPQSTR